MVLRKNDGIEKIAVAPPINLLKKIRLHPTPPPPPRQLRKEGKRHRQQNIMLYPDFYWHILVYICTVYLYGSEEHPTWLALMLEIFLEITITRLA